MTGFTVFRIIRINNSIGGIILHRRSLLIHPNDNVAVLLEPGQKGDNVVVNGKKIELLENIDFAHKILLVDLKPEDFVIKYGERIAI